MPISLQHPYFLLSWLFIPVIWLMLRRWTEKGGSRKAALLTSGLRACLVLVLGCALADPRLPASSDQVNAWFCVDRSDSIGREIQQAAEKFIRRSVEGMDEQDRAGLIVFGKHPSQETALCHDFGLHEIQSDLNPHFTNIAETLQFTLGRFPSRGSQKIVLLSDGHENLGNALQAANLAASLNVPVFPVPLASWFGDREVFIKALESPSTVALETPYEVRVVIMSSRATRGELVLLKNGTFLASRPVKLQAGKNVFRFTDSLDEPGLYLYKAVMNTQEDTFFQNNEGLAFTKGTKRSQILYLTGEHSSLHYLAHALHLQGLDVVVKSLDEVSGALYDLLRYNAIILDNVSGQLMPFMLMEHIKTYVKDMGGGLLMIGGDQSFGAGHYNKTPIEEVLPVFMDAPTDLKFSALCLVFVIDKSSSMTTRYTDKSKLELAKIAAFSAVELLNPTDQVGIVTFDSRFKWTVPIMSAGERQTIADKLTRIREGGGTELYSALEEALAGLRNVEASRKHVIVLSDGMTNDADFQTLVESASASGISVSTVAIGTDSDKELLQSIAVWGQGRSYYTDNPDTIPRIFTGETKILTKELLSETPVQPLQTAPHDMLRGIDTETLPMIDGQVITYPKPGAQMIFRTVQGPLLSAWQYGLGRSVAFTSDLSGRWGKEWVRWEHYGQFVAQIVKWAQRQETDREYRAAIERKGETGTFVVDVTDRQQHFINHLNLTANIISPAGDSQVFLLEQTAPGRYQTSFPAEEIGAYYCNLFGAQTTEMNRSEVFGFGIPYTDEFSQTGVNMELLQQLADITHGQVLNVDDTRTNIFTAAADVKNNGKALWPYLSGLFLVLLLIDVTVRKIFTTFF